MRDFVAAAEQLHFAHAAKTVGVSRATLIAAVKELEASHETPAMREKIRNNPELRETLREMKAARESNDEARMKELRQKIASEMGGAGGIAKGEAGHGEFIKKLAAILTPDQMQKLKAMREAKGEGRAAAGAGQSAAPDKTQKPDASKGVPNPFE